MLVAAYAPLTVYVRTPQGKGDLEVFVINDGPRSAGKLQLEAAASNATRYRVPYGTVSAAAGQIARVTWVVNDPAVAEYRIVIP